jgi:hypothetical protein
MLEEKVLMNTPLAIADPISIDMISLLWIIILVWRDDMGRRMSLPSI